jgi:release factor glutamine methyltransferase
VRSKPPRSDDVATVGDAVAKVSARLAAAGVEAPDVDAAVLVGHVLELTRSEVAAASRRSLEPAQVDALETLVARRERREPLQYVLGEWGFRRLALTVDSRALVPRPETELVVERALVHIAGRVRPAVLDVGTGSGAIALAIADEHPGAQVVAIDISTDALALAAENVRRTGLDVELVRHDLFAGLPRGPWDLIVSNPPYVDPAERATLQPEVRDWEPEAALFGREASEAIARSALEELASGGALVLEIAAGTGGDASRLLSGLGFVDVRVLHDLTGVDRVVEGTR